ncbi:MULTISPECIES: hypothetical protein [unclassified Roseofilum]|uniref:hypothetical protein n=1 Tax=unclassified Roseofilum TaxID=2620099 RepID=UPI001B222F48|nr:MULTISPECIES: hypothetical protein [unclassified Roseofilum]MBP0007185.1 hypothetical protein [Roseofilum sp. Belize Diploria]MBP0031828.1 hypothetical protein [Roseofilum sp. Belize BBD 4]
MYKILKATYHNGSLVLDQHLESMMEGKTFKVVLLELDEVDLKKQRFLRLVDQHSFHLSKDYQFKRDKLYER